MAVWEAASFHRLQDSVGFGLSMAGLPQVAPVASLKPLPRLGLTAVAATTVPFASRLPSALGLEPAVYHVYLPLQSSFPRATLPSTGQLGATPRLPASPVRRRCPHQSLPQRAPECSSCGASGWQPAHLTAATGYRCPLHLVTHHPAVLRGGRSLPLFQEPIIDTPSGG